MDLFLGKLSRLHCDRALEILEMTLSEGNHDQMALRLVKYSNQIFHPGQKKYVKSLKMEH